MIEAHERPGLFNPAVENVFGNVRFKRPVIRVGAGGGPWPIVVPADTLEKLSSQPADQILLSLHVGSRQPAGDHSSQVPPRLEKSYPSSFFGGGDGSENAAGSGAVDEHVKRVAPGGSIRTLAPSDAQ